MKCGRPLEVLVIASKKFVHPISVLYLCWSLCAKSMDWPITGCRELDEGEKSDGELFTASAEVPVAYWTTKKGFRPCDAACSSALKGNRAAARDLRRYADPCMLSEPTLPKSIGIEALILDCALVS